MGLLISRSFIGSAAYSVNRIVFGNLLRFPRPAVWPGNCMKPIRKRLLLLGAFLLPVSFAVVAALPETTKVRFSRTLGILLSYAVTVELIAVSVAIAQCDSEDWPAGRA